MVGLGRVWGQDAAQTHKTQPAIRPTSPTMAAAGKVKLKNETTIFQKAYYDQSRYIVDYVTTIC